MITDFEKLLQRAKKQSTMKLAVAAAQDEEVLLAVDEAYRLGIAEPILVGDGAAIRDIASRIKMDVTKFEIIDIPGVREA
ncbi:MAG TPA: phosphate acyltransferase, partial [Bacillota bacterium]|nr:phosphate acyltransferase [Bacillota bacterium]